MIDPIAFHLGPLPVHWYGLMYLLGFSLAWLLGSYRAKHSQGEWTFDQVSDLIFYGSLGVIIGGRVGYMLFYDFPTLLSDPLEFFKVWRGGMSFHGGLLGVIVAMWVFSRHTGKSLLAIADFSAPLVPLGLAAGRIGNFINGELWGRVTTVPWGMVFPGAGPLPRHPSQLYEFLLEGVLLFSLVWWYSRKPRPAGSVAGFFLLGYGVFRCFSECFRQPDPQFGYLAFGWFTMGMLLSLPMIFAGSYLILAASTAQTKEKS